MNLQKLASKSAAIAATFALAMMTGCGSGGLPDDAAAVEGVVTYQGSPVADAVVTFRSQDGFSAVGKTAPDGRYQLSSASIPGGTKIGDYQVTVVKREKLDNAMLTEEDPNYSSQQQVAPQKPQHLVPERYSRPTTSGLEATVATGPNEINFDLTD
ncbi:carboxypeptidase-like regulatory domain-containing protein [Rosistilla oblonga]|uniref:carboxypeptidase-like regulatory domain-containing protein n=1 Tax=Rosistilla oblonga TaxID=2527990 RepID=UPI003A96E05E